MPPARKDIDKNYLIEAYVTNGMSARAIGRELGINHTTVSDRIVEYGIKRPKEIVKGTLTGKEIPDNYSPLEKRTLNELAQSGYTPAQLKEFIKGLQQQKSHSYNRDYKIGKNRVKMGVFGDPHMGNIEYDPALMKHFVRECDREKVDLVLCTGDIFDGWYQNRPSSIFEQNAIGFDQQMELAVRELSQINQPFYFITGNHSYNTFVRGAGVEAGPYLESKLRDTGLEAHFLGNAEGDIELKNGSIVRMLHPDGGTAYAISYKSQKIAESFEGGHKPNILLIGHFHKAEYIFYRNIHIFQTGTFCGQSKFMKGKGLAAMKGFWLVDVTGGGHSDIDKITPTFYPVYD